MQQLKVVIVDDHKIFRKGLRFLLEETVNVKVVAEAENGREFLDMIEFLEFDVVLMDINMPVLNGIDATVLALKEKPEMKIIVLSMQDDEQYYDKMVDAGVKGFLLKNSDVEELTSALKVVSEGGAFFSQDLLLSILNKKREKKQPTEDVSFTDREVEVLNLICKGYNNNQIAEELFISIRTVERHRANLLHKTNSPNSISLVMYAIRHNVISV